MRKLNWGILGLGQIATEFAEAFDVENAVLYAAGSRNDEKAAAFAKNYALEKSYGSYDALLEDPSIDVVYIATPHSHHAELILKSLEHGKHVLSEKAITMNNDQLTQAMKLAKEKKLVLAEAMVIYHMPLYRKLKEIAQSGSLGKLKMIQVSFGSLKEKDPANRFFNKDLAGGALLDIGIYALSFARFFLTSQPKEIHTTMNFYETGVDEQSGILLKNDQNELATISLTFRAKMPKTGIVAFENGFITVNDFPRADKATVTMPDGSVETVEAGDTKQAMNYEIADITDMILSDGPNPSLALTHDVMEIMDTLRKDWGLHYDFE
ncbi:Gfo/Idh/MocA family oxidoreductase [Carnobacterium viridans]|uniref:Predicted dehydrogenase n=1 Tax=Carnobacterium viridans TaxID=174587 RepID=A0A1H0YM71_9LACT|nr:Gfo/Idh/MocA family oxidoreductase [Carnobacterium viridans]UDE95064.1 Gfo/Idh/MocA family oxidoreductase [Carnobacterium viridans]SDQ16051.1 Predicted dehydrogenase [Carnobacterium viridans]